MATRDRLERLTDLVLVLLEASTPRTLEDIARAVPGYPESHEAQRQAFERDKRLLRAEGVPILTESVEGPEQFGYRIDPDAFYLPDLGLEPDEQAALHLAVAGVHLGDPSGRDALAKLGATGVAESRPVAALVPPAALVPLFSAVRAKAEVSFRYRGETRVVAPATLRFRGGRWYLVGWDRDRGAARTFRIDRIDGTPRQGEPGSGEPPDAMTADPVLVPWTVGDNEDDRVLVWVDSVEAPRVIAEVGERAVVERRSDGSVVLGLGATSPDVLRSWILGLLDHAEVLGPPDARLAMVRWLEETASGAPGDARRGAGSGGDSDGSLGAAAALGRGGDDPEDASRGTKADEPMPLGAAAMGDVDGAASGRRRQLTASARLRRLLAIVAWLAEVGEAPIADISARFDVDESEVVRELELAACCGLPPYSPDMLLEIVVTEDAVQAFLPKDLARPRRLSPAEGLALAASGRTILAVPGADRDGALARALAKLDAVLGDHRRLVIDLDSPLLLDEVRALTDAGIQAEIAYHSASTDETTVRVVDPLTVLSLDGHWYLDAYCHRAGSVRRFRVDRLRRVTSLGVPIEHQGHVGNRPEAFVPGPSAVTVRLELDAEARWVLDAVPVLEQAVGAAGGTEVTLAVGGRAWLERLLLQLGPHARVVSPPELSGAGATAAARLLGRYASSSMK